MDAQDFRDELEAEYETELSRLGSSKAMYAVTGGEMEPAAVHAAMADRALAAAEVFDTWAEDDGPGADVFGAVADEQREHADRIASETGHQPAAADSRFDDHVRNLDAPAERAAGLLAWTLIADRTFSQAVAFFVGNAAPGSADLFRELRSAVETRQGDALDLLAAVADADDRDPAWTAAVGTIEAAYEQYVAALEDMGIKVKPVC